MKHVAVGPAQAGDLAALAALAARAQADPERFILHFAEEAPAIEAEIVGVDGWVAATHVARAGDDIVGWLLAETEPELDRVWWWGPVVDPATPWIGVADTLYAAARAELDDRYTQEELGGDDRSEPLAAFGARHGFRPEEASALLRVEIDGTAATDAAVAAMTPEDAGEVAALHDAVFPGTHATGRQLAAAADDLLLVLRDDDGLVGYVVAEVQADGEGYIDFLGVDPRRRRRGAGRSLVVAALGRLHEREVTAAHLTVRAGNVAARGLYGGLGFDERRLLRPLRKGFSLDD